MVELPADRNGFSAAEARRRSPPAGWQQAMVAMDDGWLIRTGCVPARGPVRGHILMVGGRGDFIEKYWETMADLADLGFEAASFDWRGQGLSGRLGDDAQKCHAETFDRLLADALWLVDQHWPRTALPTFVIAHSMGGHLTARLLAARPGRFDRSVLLAPMLGIRTAPLPRMMARALARWMVRHGQALRYALGQAPYGAAMRSLIRRDRLTSSLERFSDEDWFIAANPDLTLGGVTFGWLDAALTSVRALRAPGLAESIATPTLVLLPEREALVVPSATRAFARRMPDAAVEDVADARHELLRERDAIRRAVLDRLVRFFIA